MKIQIDNPTAVLEALLAQEDTDGSKTITVEDSGPKSFLLQGSDGKRIEIKGHYRLANLLQELYLAIRKQQAQNGTDELPTPQPVAGSAHAPTAPASPDTPPTPKGNTARHAAAARSVVIDTDLIDMPPLARIDHLIRTHHWRTLTRRIDEAGLRKALVDEKRTGARKYLYVPEADAVGMAWYRDLIVRVADPDIELVPLPAPRTLSADDFARIESRPGLLALKVDAETGQPLPYVVPGGRFNEMYGWDSYFIALGLIEHDEFELARGMLENMAYQIRHYGKMLNASRSYYLTRTQPPFYTPCLRAFLDAYGERMSSAWIAEHLGIALDEYDRVWMDPATHLSDIGLNRYLAGGSGRPTETEPGHFDFELQKYAQKHGLDVREFEQRYDAGDIIEPELDTYFIHDRSMRESGLDTTTRFDNCCADLACVDLNSILYRVETDLAALIEQHAGGKFNPEHTSALASGTKKTGHHASDAIGDTQPAADASKNAAPHRTDITNGMPLPEHTAIREAGNSSTSKSASTLSVALDSSTAHTFTRPPATPGTSSLRTTEEFRQRAARRQKLMTQHLWNETEGHWHDYNLRTQKPQPFPNASDLLPLWAGCCTADQAARTVANVLPKLLGKGGIASTAPLANKHAGPDRQWDYPYGWAPHQIMIWEGLSRYGFTQQASNAAFAWLTMLVQAAVDYNGLITEKFNVETGSHKVDAEYGNVGARFEYIPTGGFGWTNTSFLLGLKYLDDDQKTRLDALAG